MKRLIPLLLILVLLLTGCFGDETAPMYVTSDDDDGVLIMGRINGVTAPARIDASTGELIFILAEHHEVHEGDSYTVSDTVAADTTTVKWQVTTAASQKYAHMVFTLTSTGEALYIVTEGSDRDPGVALQEVNRLRVGTVDIAETKVTRAPTGGTTDGSIVLFSVRSGITNVASKNIEGGGARAMNEWVLRPNTKYIISVQTFAAVYVTCTVDWYEHKDTY